MKKSDFQFQECEVTCDNCNRSTTIDSPYYDYVNDAIKDEGWVIRKVDGEWCDFCCKKCYEEYRAKWQL